MGRNIVTIENFAKELEMCVSCDFFSVKELKSLANSIKWPYRFFKVSSKLKLKEEMTYLCAFLGRSALKLSASLGFLDKDFAKDCSELYVEKLTCRWLLRTDIPKSKEKVTRWESLGLIESYLTLNENLNDETEKAYREIIEIISEDFYESLTQKKCDDYHKWSLFRRFNLYFGHFIKIVEALINKGIEPLNKNKEKQNK